MRWRWGSGLAVLAAAVALQLPQVATPPAGAAPSTTTRKFVRALNRHLPAMRYDSDEHFFPVRVNAMTDNVGNRLERENEALLAERRRGGRGLNVRYLRGIPPGFYPNGDAILESDKLDVRGDDPDAAREDATRFQNSSRYGDRVYGRIVYVRSRGNEVRGAWLQYWFYYYYNDFPRIDAGFDHEGDWEMVQVRVDADAEPMYAVYAHHNTESRCSWRHVEKRGKRPVVYVAQGSHASYFRSGRQGQDVDNDGEQRRRIRGLVRIGTSSPQWVRWPGNWGDDGSPPGPRFQGARWTDPERFGTQADSEVDCR